MPNYHYFYLMQILVENENITSFFQTLKTQKLIIFSTYTKKIFPRKRLKNIYFFTLN